MGRNPRPRLGLQRRQRQRRPPPSRSRRPWSTPLLALALLVQAAATGYRLTEGWDWGDCYWMVLITLSTLGFSDGDTQILSSNGRLVTTLALVGGLLVVQLAIQSVLGLTESGYFRRLQERRFRRWMQSLENHVILCGYGRIGREIAAKLISEGIPLLVVEMDPEHKEAAEDRGLPVLMADATLDETLLEAGIQRCRSLVAALPSNAANVYVILSARGLAPNCRLIARADSEEAEGKLRLAGADQVVSPYVAGGRAMAATALRPLAVNFMDLLAGSDCEVEEFQLSSDPAALAQLGEGTTMAELQLGRRSGAMVLAIRNPEQRGKKGTTYRGASVAAGGGELIANPGGAVQLQPGQLLVVMGSKAQLERLIELLGPALAEVSHMPG
ncbi:MAG: potassium channel protein [Prochlorococcaceae cyanobacterium]